MTPVGLYQRGLTIGRNTRLRRAAYAVAIVVAAVLAVFPRSYVAYAKFLPQESTSGGAQVLAQVSSGVTNIASALSSQRGSYVIIGRSNDVQLEALKRLKAMGYAAFADQDDARVRLEKKVEIHVLSGGVIEVRSRDHDQKFAWPISVWSRSSTSVGWSRIVGTRRAKNSTWPIRRFWTIGYATIWLHPKARSDRTSRGGSGMRARSRPRRCSWKLCALSRPTAVSRFVRSAMK